MLIVNGAYPFELIRTHLVVLLLLSLLVLGLTPIFSVILAVISL